MLTVSPASEHLEIIGKKLLTCEQVRLCLLALRKYSPSSILHEAPPEVVEQVIKHFGKANIKTHSKPSTCRKIKSLHKEYLNVKRLPKIDPLSWPCCPCSPSSPCRLFYPYFLCRFPASLLLAFIILSFASLLANLAMMGLCGADSCPALGLGPTVGPEAVVRATSSDSSNLHGGFLFSCNARCKSRVSKEF